MENRDAPTALAAIFPPLGLRVRSGPLELRGIGDAEVLALLDLVRDGIHPPDFMPFSFPWTDAPPDELPLNYLQWWARQLAGWSRDRWGLNLAAVWDGEVVGVQGVDTEDFLLTRTGETGSWLGRRFQGRGIGTAMRRAWCAFLFDEVGFERLTSAAFTDNAASRRVSEKVGYRPNGSSWVRRRDASGELERFVLTPDDLVRGEPVAAEGAAEFRRFIGLEGTAAPTAQVSAMS